jgi:hypothetical protein
MSSSGCLNISIDLKQWKNLPEDERQEQIFYCLRFLTQEAQKNKTIERLLTFGAHFSASLIGIISVIIYLLHK